MYQYNFRLGMINSQLFYSYILNITVKQINIDYLLFKTIIVKWYAHYDFLGKNMHIYII